MAKTFEFDRFDVREPGREASPTLARFPAGDGEYVLAQDAIDREKVNADRIRVLEVQLKEAVKAYQHFRIAAQGAK